MKGTIDRKRRRLDAQGFKRLTDSEVVEFDRWLRLSPAICLAWTLIGVAFASPIILAALIPFAVAGFVWDRHPFDLIYDLGIRRFTGGRPLPCYGRQRRFACLSASLMLGAAAASFYFGYQAAGYVIGGFMVLAAATMVSTGFCVPSFVYNSVARAGRGAKADTESSTPPDRKTQILNPISDSARNP